MDAILLWNSIALEVHRRDFTPDRILSPAPMPEQGGPTRTSRAFAIVHAAMFDAVALTSGGLNAYTDGGRALLPAAVPAANVEAAIAGAAVEALALLWPRQKAYLDGMLQALVPSPSDPSVAAGIVLGKQIAQALFHARLDDGSSYRDDENYRTTAPHHRPDPYQPGQKRTSPHWGAIRPFCINASPAIHFTYMSPPPQYNTPRYQAAERDVASLGAVHSHTRTADERINGIFWGYDGVYGLGVPPRLYNQVVRAFIDQQLPTLSLVQHAQLFALVNAAMADAAIVAWSGKYHSAHDLWRPVAGIRNSPTAPEPDWAPLGAPQTNAAPGQYTSTPGFPAYPSGHATFGGASFAILAHFAALIKERTYLDVLASDEFVFVSDEYDGHNQGGEGGVRQVVAKPYTLQTAIIDNALSRVHLGVHWRFDGLGIFPPDDLGPVDLNDPSKGTEPPGADGVVAEKQTGGVAAGLQIAREIFDAFSTSGGCFASAPPAA
jgi:hypothetical protein